MAPGDPDGASNTLTLTSTSTNYLPCKKCKALPAGGMVCIKCNSLNHPSCVKLLKNIQILDKSSVICCNDKSNFHTDLKEPFVKDSDLRILSLP
ncbi:hypothetical protein Zmor_002302 [Zophobas morio]|uniref:Phorbol-ester/DAG-type domain-containing protein n=1 Tax=Zophobas morio TaxID=2755281 RepID=A0AA38MPW7_9CUCU|nr:hypothetical protein Zmor_002302 [Zophobas morio]